MCALFLQDENQIYVLYLANVFKVAKDNRMTDIRILIILCEWLLGRCIARLPIE